MGKGKRGELVARPPSKDEYEIYFITIHAAKGWTDALSQFRNAMSEAWDKFTVAPKAMDGQRIYVLKYDLRWGTYAGKTHERYQYKVSDAARIWYFVDDELKRVLIERVHVGHPKETE